MKNSDRVVDIIEDHACVIQTLGQIYEAIESGSPMPNYIPVLNDVAVSDCLSKICETINKYRRVYNE